MPFKIRTILSGTQTQNRLTVFEEITPPGEGPPLHLHMHQIEIFHVIRGRYLFALENNEVIAEAGACVFIPIGAAHTFKNIGTDDGLIHFELLPSGSAELFFDTLVKDFDTISDMSGFFRKHGIELLGPPIS